MVNTHCRDDRRGGKLSTEEELIARFNQHLNLVLIKSDRMGQRRSSGYIMGALREVMKDFDVSFKSDDDSSVPQ